MATFAQTVGAFEMARNLEMVVDFRSKTLIFEHPTEGTVEMFTGFDEDDMVDAILQAVSEIEG